MKKNKLFVVLLMPILLLLPFGNYAKAQVPSYVGVEAGDQYTWSVEVKLENVDDLLGNVRDVIVDWKAGLPSLNLFGLESLTIAELSEFIAEAILSNILPTGWESLNITDLIRLTIIDYVENFNATFLSEMIPSNWLSLNFSDFYDLAFDGINDTLFSSGWEDDPLPHLTRMAINELNSTILFGLIPTGWEAMTLGDFFSGLLMPHIPVLWESTVVQLFLDSGLFSFIPSEIADDTIGELIDEFMSTVPGTTTILNATALFEEMFFGLNQTMPGIESESMTDILDALGTMVNSTLPGGIGASNMSSLLGLGIDMLDEMLEEMGLNGSTILEMLDMGFTELLAMFDLNILPGWTSTYASMQGLGMVSTEAGLRVNINSLGTETGFISGGPRGVPINMDYLVSYGTPEWLNVSELLGPGFSPISLLYGVTLFGGLMTSVPEPPAEPGVGFAIAIHPLIVDPSSYLIAETALADQVALTGGLIVANNYNWASIQTDLTMPTTGNPDAISMSAEWNSKGVLKAAEFKADGLVVAEITLVGEDTPEIPGYETVLILGLSSAVIIAIIFQLKRKNRNFK